MAKFCTKCGRELTEGIKFCPGCGAPIPGGTSAPEQASGQNNAPAFGGMPGSAGGTAQPMGNPAGITASKAKLKLPVLAAGIVGIILVIFVVMKLVSGGGYKKPIENLEKGLNKQDIKLINKAFAGGGIPESEITDMFEGLGGIVDYEVKFDIIGERKIPKDEIEYVLEEDYYVDEVYAKSATAAYVLDINMSVSVAGLIDESDTEEVPVAKIDGKWVIPEDLTNIF